jgi:hypothetical protein
MKLSRLAPAVRILLLSFGAAGFVLAAVSLALDVVILGQRHAETPAVSASAPAGITRWSDLEPENPTAFAAHLRALGCPEAAVKALLAIPASTLRQSAVANSNVSVATEASRETKVSSSSGVSVGEREDPGFVAENRDSLNSASTRASSNLVRRAGDLYPASLGGLPARSANASYPRTPKSGNPVSAVTARSPVSGTASSLSPAESTPTGNDAVIVAPAGEDVKIPAVYESPSPQLALNDLQKQEWVQLQDRFANAVAPEADSVASPDPASWRPAQASSDEIFRAKFGDQAFIYQQMQANRHSDDSAASAQ